jgi:hypothetical protein
MDKESEFRDRARDHRLHAAKATGLEKAQWLKIAAEWERLAEQADRFPDIFE